MLEGRITGLLMAVYALLLVTGQASTHHSAAHASTHSKSSHHARSSGSGRRPAAKSSRQVRKSKTVGYYARSGRHHAVSHRHAARRNQGPAEEQTLEEIFPPGHHFTAEEKAEASALGVYMQNGRWKDAYKMSSQAVKQHPERWWLHAARATAAANLNRPKDTLDSVQSALQNNQGDANRGNLNELYVLQANAYSQLNRKSEAITSFLNAAKLSPRDPYSRAGAAWLYATANDNAVRNGSAALGLAAQANKLSGGKDGAVLDVLAAAYAETGDFLSAQQTAAKAIAKGDPQDIPYYQRRLATYQTAKPWRESLR